MTYFPHASFAHALTFAAAFADDRSPEKSAARGAVPPKGATPENAASESSPRLVLMAAAADSANDALPARSAGSTEVFRRELGQHLPALRRRALSLCKNRADADDLVSDTLLRALRFEAHFQEGTNLGAWIGRIMTNIFISRCRRRSRERDALGQFRTDPNLWGKPSPAPGPMLALLPSVERALNELPPKYQAVLRLIELEDHAYRDAADRLGVPLGTIMSRLHRARRMLADRLRDDETPVAA